jgi:hypothetical protein
MLKTARSLGTLSAPIDFAGVSRRRHYKLCSLEDIVVVIDVRDEREARDSWCVHEEAFSLRSQFRRSLTSANC